MSWWTETLQRPDIDDPRFHEKRLALFSERKTEIASAFLSWYTENHANLGGGVREAFAAFATARIEEGVPLLRSERGLLLWAITHTTDGRTRILLARPGLPDKFTECREPVEHSLPAHRLHDDLKREEGEPTEEWLTRIGYEMGFYSGGPPPTRRFTLPEDVRLPYRDREPGEEG